MNRLICVIETAREEYLISNDEDEEEKNERNTNYVDGL